MNIIPLNFTKTSIRYPKIHFCVFSIQQTPSNLLPVEEMYGVSLNSFSLNEGFYSLMNVKRLHNM